MDATMDTDTDVKARKKSTPQANPT